MLILRNVLILGNVLILENVLILSVLIMSGDSIYIHKPNPGRLSL